LGRRGARDHDDSAEPGELVHQADRQGAAGVIMHFLLSSAEKDLRRQLRDPMALVLWLGIPLLIGGLITLVMGGMDQAPPTAHLLVADEDGGQLSGLLARAFSQTESAKFLR